MSTWSPVPLATQSAEGRSAQMSRESLVNCYLEAPPQPSKYPFYVVGTPGLKRKITFATAPIRGMQKMGAYLWVVSGDRLYRVDSSYNSTDVGEIKGTGDVDMTENGIHVAVVTNVNMYAANIDEILEVDLTSVAGGLTGATYQDGYGIFAERGSENFWVTSLLASGVPDMTTVNGLDFAPADTFADQLVGLISDHRELWLFGQDTIEVWQNTGNPVGSPFSRAGSGFMERGCAAGGSIAKADNRVYWLGDDLRVYTAASYQPQPISNPAIEKQIGELDSPQTARGFTYTQEGHTFYVLTFRDKTFVFDITTGRWHTRKSFNETRWRVQHHEYQWRRNIVGDFENGKLYELDFDTYDEDGAILERELVFPPLSAGGRRAIMDELAIDIEVGVGLVTGQGSDPQLMLDWSDDSGSTHSNELTRSIGKIGEYDQRVRFNRLGAFRKRDLRLRITDPVKAIFMAAAARLEVLSE